MRTARAYIGTSGWNYQHWRGEFYPENVRQADWLAFFAGHFDSVEVNNVFYRLPSEEMVCAWSERTPERFRFSTKMWRGITHRKKLRDCGEYLGKFFAAIEALPTSQRGPVLIQLPPQQGLDVEKLDAFLELFKQVTRPSRWKAAVEFRHPDWYCPDTYEVLDRHRAALCLHDMPRATVSRPNEASFIYVRRHGPRGDYRGSYTDAQLEDDARRIQQWLGEGRTVYVYFNNDGEARAVYNAMQLKHLIERS